MIKAHWAYLKIVLRHKLAVLKGCRIMGVPLWRGLMHDMSKFSLTEWNAYVNNFYNSDGTKKKIRNPDGSYDPSSQTTAFTRAWLHHHKNNKHHWQSWISIGDCGKLTPVEIPDVYIREIIADWIGAGIAYSNESNPYNWFASNVHKMILHPASLSNIILYMSWFKKGSLNV